MYQNQHRKNIMYCLLVKALKNDRLKRISSKVFKNYNEAYLAFRSILKELGLLNDSVFDGQGNIKEMYKYFKRAEKECSNEDWWSADYMNPIKYLNALVLNKEIKYKPFSESDSMTTWKYKNKVFELISTEEGPINGILPIVKTNIDLRNQNHCYFYVNDNFGGNGKDGYSVNELYIDLVKTEDNLEKKSRKKPIKEDDFDKRFDEKFGTGTDVFDVDEYMKRMDEMREFK